MDPQPLSRRQRYREQTTREIKAIAAAQVADGGAPAVSLNAIAKTMGMSPGALYRYFDNRDDLLAELVVDGYDDLADHLEQASATAGPSARLRDVATAYRGWALANPNTYRMIFESSSGSGRDLAPERIVPASQRSMDVFLTALADTGPAPDHIPVAAALRRQIDRWGKRARPGNPTELLYRALSSWTRLHGLISLELGHHLQATGVDPGLLFAAEVERIAGH